MGLIEFSRIETFEQFCQELRWAGFALGGANGAGIFTLQPWFSEELVAHTGDPQTDPWVWCIRALEECGDLAYGKFFFRKGGWITREWFPRFLAVRRGSRTLQELYEDGCVSALERQVYRLIEEQGPLGLHQIKASLPAEGGRVESAVTGLQSKLFLTIAGETRKRSKTGEPYGWPVTVVDTVERFWGGNIFEQFYEIDPARAEAAIRDRIRQLNPAAQEAAVRKFLKG